MYTTCTDMFLSIFSQVPIIIHNESEQARAWSQIFSQDTKKQSIPVIASWRLNERMYLFFLWPFFLFVLKLSLSLNNPAMTNKLVFPGTVNYKVSISRKRQIDMGRNKFMSGVGVMMYLPQMARAWKCVLKGPLLISKMKYGFNSLVFSYLIVLYHFFDMNSLRFLNTIIL